MKKLMLMSAVSLLALVPCVYAEPGQGLRAGAWTLRPRVDAMVGYDTNPDRAFLSGGDPSDIDESDTFVDGAVGLRLLNTGFQRDISMDLQLGRRIYQDLTENDFTYGGERLNLNVGSPSDLRVELNQGFHVTEESDSWGSPNAVGSVSPDTVLDVSARVRREVLQVGGDLERDVTDKVRMGVGYRFESVDYDEDQDESARDLESRYGNLEASMELTDKSRASTRVVVGTQDNESTDEFDYFSVLAGLLTQGTDKLSADAAVGYQRLAGDESDADGFHFQLASIWQATEKVDLQVGARNGLQASSIYEDNASEFTAFWVTVKYDIAPTTTFSLSGTYREDDYVEPVLSEGVQRDREDDGFGVRARVDYQAPSSVLGLFGEVSYEEVDSTVPSPAYDDRTRAVVGATVTY
jgi:hypothetical protein